MRRDLLLAGMLILLWGATGAQASPQNSGAQQEKAEEEKSSGMSSQSQPEPSKTDQSSSSVSRATKYWGARFLQDQRQIWTSPARLSWADADILVPVGMATGGLLATDTDFSKHLSNSPSRLSNSRSFSNYGLAAMGGLDVGLYAWGHITHDEHKKETGIIAGEAALNAYLVTTALGYALGRSRPLDSQYQGDFWHGGTSMPSDHAALSWAIASVVAHEYPGTFTGILVYGLASAISTARITSKEHFPSDVFIGSLIGWYVGKQAYRAHHDPELGGSEWLSYGEFKKQSTDDRSASLGTTFVPLNSWIYPAMKRLISLGLIQSQFMDMQPWTRLECARLLQEAGERISSSNQISDEVRGIYNSLLKEFATDTERIGGGGSTDTAARVESAYTRLTEISGQPLHDSYHFGQTIIDDFGRPYGEGPNAIVGGSAYIAQGRFAIYASGEYEYASSNPTYSAAVNNAISVMDNNPVQPGTFPSVSQFRLMDTYVSSNQANWILSFGKQTLWWSPDYSNAFLMSDNAGPIYMFRATREAPFEIPFVSKLLGPMKVDLFMGKLSGNQFPPRPLIHGEKFSFKPVPNLEFGFSRTAEFGGVGRAITPKAIELSYFSLTNSDLFAPGEANPGKRMSAWDINYRVPGLRDWLTIYADTFATDNVSPFADFQRAAVAPGFYLTRIPKLHKLDLRVETSYTDTPKVHGNLPNPANGQFNYYDSFYHDLYTNEGFLIGSWVGREGHAYQAWSTYHFSGLNSIQFAYRHSSVADDFIPHGGSINDASVRANWWVHTDVNFTGMLQYERWNYPLLANTPQMNWTTALGVTFYPKDMKLPLRSSQ
jgi:Capsule assembly protein Wzi/PAP2 superfamily